MSYDTSKFGGLGGDLNHFFRYIYGGFMLCLIIAIIYPAQAIDLYEKLGGGAIGSSIFIIIAINAIGTSFYVLYKTLVSEMFIDHIHLSWLFWGIHSAEKCIFRYFSSIGVRKQEWNIAMRLVRNIDFDSGMQKIFWLRHSESHVLYMTATISFIGLVCWIISYFWQGDPTPLVWLPLLILLIVSFIGGIYSDIKLCADECSYSKLIGEGKLSKTLSDAGILSKQSSE